MSGDNGDWCTIESDPGVFTEMLEELGCKTVELEELWSLDDSSLDQLTSSGGQVYGLIFLFKWVGSNEGETKSSDEAARLPLAENEIPTDLFFAHQVTTNACATQAILSVLFNANLSGDELGKTLKEFYSFTETFPPSLKGEAISSSAEIRTVHNKFARPDSFLQEGKNYSIYKHQQEDVYHFVAYIPHATSNTVYELDGLQSGPIQVGSYNPDDKKTGWLAVAREAIQNRMIKMGNEIKFNLMAVIQDHRIGLSGQVKSLEGENKGDGDEQASKVAAITQEIESQNQKRHRWKLENQRRCHNYLPFCMELLKGLASNGSLQQLTQEAKERHTTKIINKKAKTSN